MPFYRCIFSLGACDPIAGCDVFTFETEEHMLMEWRAFIVGHDPDVVIGYNSLPFHLAYLLHRSERLDLPDFKELGRLAGE